MPDQVDNSHAAGDGLMNEPMLFNFTDGLGNQGVLGQAIGHQAKQECN